MIEVGVILACTSWTWKKIYINILYMYNIYQQTFIYRSCCCEVALADGLGVGLWAPSISQAPGGVGQCLWCLGGGATSMAMANNIWTCDALNQFYIRLYTLYIRFHPINKNNEMLYSMQYYTVYLQTRYKMLDSIRYQLLIRYTALNVGHVILDTKYYIDVRYNKCKTGVQTPCI